MTYATAADLTARYDKDGSLTRLCGGTLDAAWIAQGLAEAGAEIDGLLQGLAPPDTASARLTGIACVIAWYWLRRWRGQIKADSPDLAEYKAVRADLAEIARGAQSAGAALAGPAGGEVSVDAPERVFTPDTLRGF